MSQYVEKNEQLSMFPEHVVPPVAVFVARAALFTFYAYPYVLKAIDALQNVLRTAETMRSLMEMSDRELAELGIERADIGALASAISEGKEAEFRAEHRQTAEVVADIPAQPELKLAA